MTGPAPEPSFERWFQASHPRIPLAGAAAVLRLAGEGATVPFMARYRKEQTGNLDEVALQAVLDAHERFEIVIGRQKFIVAELERQKKLTPELKDKILATLDPDALEDLYLPYKQKRKTKATLAREAGLQPLADWIWNCAHGSETPLEGQTLELWAFTFRNEEKGFPDLESVLQGAQDVLTERLAELPELRQAAREALLGQGHVRTAKAAKAKAHSKYEKYFAHTEPVQSLLKPEHSHRYLAMRRGAAEGELSLSIAGPPDDAAFEQRLLGLFEAAACEVPASPGAALLSRAAGAALQGYVLPSIENEVHRALKHVADEVATRVFADNLRGLLLASPFGPKAVLGVDPGLRTGCKLALVGETGAFVLSDVLHLESDAGRQRAREQIDALLRANPVQAVAVGNGTAGRESEAFLRAALAELGHDVPVVLVSEDGASVYSASGVAREEFPQLDVTVRGAISIARRLQDPLAELVKIEPRSIGVGQYQHDVAPHALKRSLERVVDSCVNQVGVNLNTASHHLLAHVSGIGPALAQAVIEHRAQHGLFRSRRQLLEVPRFTRKTFEQAAGFLRVAGGEHPLDNTGVHPERYPVLERLAERLGKQVGDLLGAGAEALKAATDVRAELGALTFDDVVREIAQPGRDPREAFVPFAFRDDVRRLEDLRPGMECPGIVTNVTNFGAFVDVGVHHDGLVHVSQVSDRFVKDPREVVHPGLRVTARVLSVDLDKQQIALTLKTQPAQKVARGARGRAAPGGGRTRGRGARRGPGAPAAATGKPDKSGAARRHAPPAAPTPAAPRAAGAGPAGASRQGSDATRTSGPSSAGARPAPGARARKGSARPDKTEGQRTGGPGQGAGARPDRPRSAPLNNPFAILADLKEALERRGS